LPQPRSRIATAAATRAAAGLFGSAPISLKTASASGDPGHGTYVVEFRTAAGEALAISIPRTECAVIRHFQELLPDGLFVPDLNKP